MDSMQPNPAPAPQSKLTTKKILLGVALILALVGGGIWWANHEAARQAAIKELHEEIDAESFAHEATVTLTAAGFVPSKLTISKSTRVYFENKDSAYHSVITDDATKKLEPNLGNDEDTHAVQEIAPAGGHAYSFHNTGTFRAHDGHNPTANIEIEVK